MVELGACGLPWGCFPFIFIGQLVNLPHIINVKFLLNRNVIRFENIHFFLLSVYVDNFVCNRCNVNGPECIAYNYLTYLEIISYS